MKLLSTSAILASMVFPSAYAATIISDGNSYGPTDDATGYTYDDPSPAEITFTTSDGNYFNIGNDSTTSLNNTDSGTLTVSINNGGGSLLSSGVSFENDIRESHDGDIILNVDNGNVVFRGETDSIQITAGNGSTPTTTNLNFEDFYENETGSRVINATIDAASNANTVNINIIKSNNNSEDGYFEFNGDIGGSTEATKIDTINIRNSEYNAPNIAIFNGSINADIINIGDNEETAHNVGLNIGGSSGTITADIIGRNVNNTEIIVDLDSSESTKSFTGAISNIDTFYMVDSGSIDLSGKITNTDFEIDADDAQITFSGNYDNDSDILVTSGSDDTTLIFSGDSVIYSGDIEIEDVALGNEIIFSGDHLTYSGDISAEGDSATRLFFNDENEEELSENRKTMTLSGETTLSNFNDEIEINYSNVTLSDDIGFGDGNDDLTIVYSDTTISRDIDFGTGDDNLFTSESDVTISGDLDFGNGDDSLSLNDSTISLSGDVTNLELTELNYSSTLTLTDGGSITGDIVGIDGNGDVVYDSETGEEDFYIDGTINNVYLTVESGNVHTNGYVIGGEDALRELRISSDSTFNAQDNVFVGNSGIEIYGGTLQIGAGATVTTNSFFSDSGTLLIDIASPTSAGFLSLTDDNINLEGLDVEANITGTDNPFTHNNQIKVAEGTSALIGTDGNEGQTDTAIAENSVLFSINMMDGSKLEDPLSANDLYFVFRQDMLVQEAGSSSNNRDAGKTFDNLQSNTNVELNAILANLSRASQSELDQILESTTPDVGGGAAVGSQNFVNNTLDVTNEQIQIAMNTKSGVATGGAYDKVRVWSQAFAQDASQGQRKGIAGFDAKTFGLALGADTKNIIEDGVIGAAFSYGSTDVNSKNASNSSNEIESYQLTVYGSKDLPQDFFIKGMLAYAHNSVDTERYNIGGLGLTAKGNYDASIYTARTDVGKDFNFNGTRITPSFMTHYSHYSAEDYTEKGAGGANLSITQNELQMLEFGATIEAGWDLVINGNKFIKPEIRAGYRYDVIGDEFQTNASFVGGGSSFQTIGANPAQAKITLGGGITYAASDNWELSANYEYESRQDFKSNSGFLRSSFKF